jgi:hypothetical protein
MNLSEQGVGVWRPRAILFPAKMQFHVVGSQCAA